MLLRIFRGPPKETTSLIIAHTEKYSEESYIFKMKKVEDCVHFIYIGNPYTFETTMYARSTIISQRQKDFQFHQERLKDEEVHFYKV